MNYQRSIILIALCMCLASPKFVLSQVKINEFSFTLNTPSETSAGIFKNDSILVRTLWSGLKYSAGTYNIKWDGTDDSKNVVEPGNYTAKVLSNNVQSEWEGVIGNSSKNKSGSGVHRGYLFMSDMCIAGGYIYYPGQYDEKHETQHKAAVFNPNVAVGISGSGECDSYLVTTDGTNVYWGSKGRLGGEYNKFFVFATKVSNDARVSFAEGDNINLDYEKGTYNCIGYSSNVKVTDIAVQKAGKYLFVAEAKSESLLIYDKVTGAFVKKIGFPSINKLATDGSDGLWVGSTKEITKFKVEPDGSLSQKLIVNYFSDLKALEVSPDNNRIIVIDGGNSQQVKSFSTFDGSKEWNYGQEGGYRSNPEVKNDKFYFDSTNNFIAFENDGSFWISDGMNFRAQHYSTSRSFKDRIMYCPYSYAISVDRKDSSRVFLKYLEFKIDYSKPLSADNDSWVLIRNWATPDLYANYNDQFVDIANVTTLSNGRTYCIANSNSEVKFEILELNPSLGLRKTGSYFDFGSQLYADGVYNITPRTSVPGDKVEWIKSPLVGFDLNGNPKFGQVQILASTIKTDKDPIFNGNLTNGTFGEIQDGNIITFDGGAGIYQNESKGYHLGAIKLGTNQFVFKTAYNTETSYQGTFPEDEKYDIGNGTNYPGSKAIVIDDIIVQGHHGEFWKGGQTNEYKLFYKNGLLLKNFGTNIQEINEEIAAAEMAGNAFAMNVTKCKDTVYLYHGDESYHSGLHRWKITGLKTIALQVVPLSSSFEVTDEMAILPGIDLMKELPYDSILKTTKNGWSREPEIDDYTNYDNFWSVKTNVKTYSKRKSPDLYIKYQHSRGPYKVKRDLGNNSDLTSWKISGKISYEDNSPNGNNGTSMYLQVLDNTGKTIVNFYTTAAYGKSSTITIYANNTIIHTGSFESVHAILNTFQPIAIKLENNSIKVSFANYPTVTVNPLQDNTVISSPKTIQIAFDYNGVGTVYNKIIDLDEFRFSAAKPNLLFRSQKSGSWKDASTWQTSADNLTWLNAETAPDYSANEINIRSGNNVEIDSVLTVDQLLVLDGGGMTVTANGSIRVNDGAGEDIKVANLGRLIFKADSTGTGTIGNSSGTIAGNVTVETYIDAINKSTYRLLSPIVSTQNSIKPYIRDNWQEGQNNTNSVLSNKIPNYGIQITGPGTGANGFDEIPTKLPSIFTFQPSASLPEWKPLMNTNSTPLEANKGYLVFVQGDRSVNLLDSKSRSNTTLRTTGQLSTGEQRFSSMEGNGQFYLISNPYLSPIDWSKIYNDESTANAQGFENYFSYWDPNVGQHGGFVSTTSQGFQSAPLNEHFSIQTGQAFFIKAKNGVTTPVLTLKESHKTSTDSMSQSRSSQAMELMTSLQFVNEEGKLVLADAVNSIFDDAFSAEVDGNDATEIANWEENIAIQRGGKMLSIETRSSMLLRDTIPLAIQRMKAQNYQWIFHPKSFSKDNMQAYLLDTYLNTKKSISLNSDTRISFTVSTDELSSSAARFSIIFAPNEILPVNMSSLKAYQNEEDIVIEWISEQEKEIEHYEIEKSTGSTGFASIGKVKAQNESLFAQKYSFVDVNPVKGNNIYRIKTIEKNGQIKHSKIVTIYMGKERSGVEIFPNPIIGDIATIQFNNIQKGSYNFTLYSMTGEIVLHNRISHVGGSSEQKVLFSKDIRPGMYCLQIKGENLIFNTKLLKN